MVKGLFKVKSQALLKLQSIKKIIPSKYERIRVFYLKIRQKKNKNPEINSTSQKKLSRPPE
jgi:hypothetical protein